MSENTTQSEQSDGMDSATNIDVPEELRYSDDHVWVEDLDGLSALGITDYAASQMGDLVFLDLPEVGDRVEAGDEVVQLESAKAVQPLVSPVAGTVKYVNQAVSDDPEIVNNDPYGEGWLLKIEPDDDQPELMEADQYAAMVHKLA